MKIIPEICKECNKNREFKAVSKFSFVDLCCHSSETLLYDVGNDRNDIIKAVVTRSSSPSFKQMHAPKQIIKCSQHFFLSLS